MQRIEEINDALPQLIFQVKLFTLGDLLATLNQIICPLVNVLKEILSSGFQQKNLIIVVTMVRQVTALLANELVVQAAVGDVISSVVRAQRKVLWTRVLLVRLLLLVMAMLLHGLVVVDL